MDFIKNLDTAKLLEKAKPMAIASVCFVAVFTAGFGVGKSSSTEDTTGATKRSLNYTTSEQGNSNTKGNDKTQQKPTTTTPTTAPVDKSNCYIKGSKSKLYHVPGGSFYERTNPAACFNSEEEAQAAGYSKSSR